MTRIRAAAGTNRAITLSAGRAACCVDIDLDGAEEVDVLAVRRRNVRQHLIVDALALAAGVLTRHVLGVRVDIEANTIDTNADTNPHKRRRTHAMRQ